VRHIVSWIETSLPSFVAATHTSLLREATVASRRKTTLAVEDQLDWLCRFCARLRSKHYVGVQGQSFPPKGGPRILKRPSLSPLARRASGIGAAPAVQQTPWWFVEGGPIALAQTLTTAATSIAL